MQLQFRDRIGKEAHIVSCYSVMPVPKFLQCLPCMPQNDVTDPSSVNDGDLTTPVGRGFPRRQIAKGVAVVLSGYDSTTAAVSVGGGCDAETVDLWVQMYRPPFFEDGMQCPPALILWWIKELDRKDQLALAQQDQNQLILNNNIGSGGMSGGGGGGVMSTGSQKNMRLFYPSGMQGAPQYGSSAFQLQQQQQQQSQQNQYSPQLQTGNPNLYVPGGSQQQQGSSSGQYSMAAQQQQQQQQAGNPGRSNRPSFS